VDPDCIFCKIIKREIPADIVFEDDAVLAFNDIGPQAPHHVLIIPKQHIATVNEVSEAQAALIGLLTLRARAIAAERGIDESGYRLIMNCNAEGGQTVFHLHMHLMGGRQLRGLG
jgi:histidine triad (HIT) family protein